MAGSTRRTWGLNVRTARRSIRLIATALVVAGVVSSCGSSIGGQPARPAPTTAASSVSDVSDDGEAPVPFIGTLRFDWPVECDVAVIETVERDGETVQFGYPLLVREAGDDIEVSYGELYVIHVNDQPVPDSEQEQLTALFTQPAFIVDRQGIFVAMSGVDEMLRNMQSSGVIGEVPDRDAFVAVVEEQVFTKHWGSWAGRWVEWPEVTADVTDDVVTVPVGETDIKYDLRRESLAPPDSGSAHLRHTTTIQDGDLERFAAATYGALSGGDVNAPFGEVTGQKVTVVEAVLDPTTMRPTTARLDDRTEITIDGEANSRIEVRVWEFDWSSPSCS